MLPFSYAELLLLQAAAAVVLLGVFLIIKRWAPPPGELQSLLRGAPPELPSSTVDHLVPLLVFEDRYPGFSNIVGVVLRQFPLAQFLEDETFKSNFTYLSQAGSEVLDPQRIRLAMCHVVYHLLRDPDVEYHCRPQLAGFVEDFLAEIEKEELLEPEQQLPEEDRQLRA